MSDKSLGSMLEDALVANPDDIASHAAFADYLSELGDARGEFIQIQLALEDSNRKPEERLELQRRERELLASHQAEWLGELAAFEEQKLGFCFFRFSRGWLDSITMDTLCIALVRALNRTLQARFLRRMIVDRVFAFDEDPPDPGEGVPANSGYPSLNLLANCHFLRYMRVLQIGQLEEYEDGRTNNCMVNQAELPAVELVRAMPRLEELRLGANQLDTNTLFALDSLHHLRVLQVYHTNHYPLERLAANPSLGRLTHLLLHPHALETGRQEAYLSLPHVQAVVRSPHLRSLTHLRLRLCDMGDAGCEEIVRSGILKRLKMLDLMYGRITDEGAAILAHCPDIRNLELLNLSWNRLTEAGLDVLRATGAPIQSQKQYDISGGGWLRRLFGPGEDEYLYCGDME